MCLVYIYIYIVTPKKDIRVCLKTILVGFYFSIFGIYMDLPHMYIYICTYYVKYIPRSIFEPVQICKLEVSSQEP
jgi:hypothetical protein